MAIRANAIVGLIKETNYLLDQQIRKLEKDFLNEGVLRERMAKARRCKERTAMEIETGQKKRIIKKQK